MEIGKIEWIKEFTYEMSQLFQQCKSKDQLKELYKSKQSDIGKYFTIVDELNIDVFKRDAQEIQIHMNEVMS